MSQLLEQVTAVCDEALARIERGPVHDGLLAIRRRLEEPLRVAVAGRVSAGKSTLVNALLGLPVAPTAAGECTRIVTWYRYGETDRAQLELSNGTTRDLALRHDRSLPEAIGVDPASARSITVWLYNASLRDLILVDTPGVSGMAADAGGRTEEFLAVRSQAAVAQADALIYVLTQNVHEDDYLVLEGFRASSRGLRASSMNAVGALNKIDKLDVGDVHERARSIADRCAQQLAVSIAAVEPVIGLLAETAEAGRLSEQRARNLEAVARLPDERRRLLLLSVRRWREAADLPLDESEREELLQLLDLHGIQRCVEWIRAGEVGAAALTRRLREESGIVSLRRVLDESFGQRARLLKADTGLHALRHMLRATKDREGSEILAEVLRRSDDRLTLLPDMHRLREMEVLHSVASGALRLPEELEEDLRRLVAGGTPLDKLGLEASEEKGALRSVALARASRWQAFGNEPHRSLAETQAAHVVGASYVNLIQALPDGQDG